jgi:hypothetical protein
MGYNCREIAPLSQQENSHNTGFQTVLLNQKDLWEKAVPMSLNSLKIDRN